MRERAQPQQVRQGVAQDQEVFEGAVELQTAAVGRIAKNIQIRGDSGERAVADKVVAAGDRVEHEAAQLQQSVPAQVQPWRHPDYTKQGVFDVGYLGRVYSDFPGTGFFEEQVHFSETDQGGGEQLVRGGEVCNGGGVSAAGGGDTQ